MFAQLAAAILLAAGSAPAVVTAHGAAPEPAVAASEALSDDLLHAGYENGLLPAELLVEIESSADCLLEHAAAEHWLALEEQARADGIEFVARWCYRNMTTQQRTYDRNCPPVADTPADPAAVGEIDDPQPVQTGRKCRVATAKPGNSNHGWGRAIDIKVRSRLLSCDSPEFEWLVVNAPDYGWVHPDWAGCGEPKEEAWHWEWAGVPVRDEPPRVPSPATLWALAPWLAETDWFQLVPQPKELVAPNWINAFLRGADPS